MLHHSRHSAGERLSQTTLLLSVVVLFVVSACRDKNNTIVGPGPGPGGSWSIVLDTSSTIYTDNDTISVRLFTPDGSLATGKLLNFAADVSVDSISRSATTRDTLLFPWGSQPAVLYWGTGYNGQDVPTETIEAFYIDYAVQPHDTLAHASRSYQVMPSHQ